MAPIVSIIIPNYNNTLFLEKLIKCFQNQTFTNWEAIIVDDCSTDNSLEFATSFSLLDSRIKVYSRNRQPKGGQTCRNLGYEYSKGKYVVFFDSDDMISYHCLEQRVKFMESRPDLDFSVFPTHSFKPREDYHTLTKLDISWGKRISKDVIDKFLRNEYPFLVVSCIYRKESLKNIRWREDIPVRQDLMFNLAVLFSKLKFDFCDNAEYDYFYRVEHSDNNVSRNMTTLDKYQGMLAVFNYCIDNINHFKLDSQKKKYFNALKRYIVNYGGQLATSNKFDLCHNYLDYIKINFSSFFVNKLRIAFFISKELNASNNVILNNLIFMLIFWYKYYFDLIKKFIKKIIYI